MTHPSFTRRGFLGSLGFGSLALDSLAAGSGEGASATSAGTALRPNVSDFPPDFQWGVATSAFQIEGAASDDGRKPSVWDTFSRVDGRVKGGDTGDVACDHYRRFAGDVKLMADLGVKHYRFSISWPRIVPDGRGAVNDKGIDFYKRLVDTLRDHGIRPHATLFHWDSPQALEDRYGSWRSREMAKDFADYCSAVVSRLGDRITDWMTINEIFCFTYMGYGVGGTPQHAPGTVVKRKKEVQQTVHHALLAHGLGCQAIRAASPVPCKVALVVNCDTYVPVIETPGNIAAAKKAFLAEEHNGTVLVPALTGEYGPGVLETLGSEAPEIAARDMEIIGQPLDVLGINLYTGQYTRAAENSRGYEILGMPESYPKMQMPWLNLVPESMYWAIRLIGEAIGKKDLPLVISENGCASDDQVSSGGEVVDLDRVLYLRSYLRQASRAVAEGYPLKGYFQWSLLDNFEWSYGYARRFGMVHVDFATQKRTPKQSFEWYRQVIREGRVL
ncbi:GH1 family beta-glucosidase [Luteolibacter sp. LG18]|uniref:GH1 family beta-glucosidase n=1 Tax=Luteolibacter sp. LG18 TaxID=2819286 RepID=UPI002B2B5EA8|nr:beta-glucosidase [Luteolibacter sp. LG18]